MSLVEIIVMQMKQKELSHWQRDLPEWIIYLPIIISNAISNFAKNVNNYLTQDSKRAFDQLRQAFTKALIF